MLTIIFVECIFSSPAGLPSSSSSSPSPSPSPFAFSQTLPVVMVPPPSINFGNDLWLLAKRTRGNTVMRKLMATSISIDSSQRGKASNSTLVDSAPQSLPEGSEPEVVRMRPWSATLTTGNCADDGQDDTRTRLRMQTAFRPRGRGRALTLDQLAAMQQTGRRVGSAEELASGARLMSQVKQQGKRARRKAGIIAEKVEQFNRNPDCSVFK
ncbi:unnamed protein product [Protopolystoma xenopodis]|uniref:Uncharacterized protein n=1 Tax=Protopolystoma xenopodis TaxID=117903 RepID=A0A3S5CV04_9PLAT|nr:unnamed protein product [Protopolystoma xenopodis]